METSSSVVEAAVAVAATMATKGAISVTKALLRPVSNEVAQGGEPAVDKV